MTVTIYHNPACGTSRNALAMIRNAGIEPRIVEYLKAPPSRDELMALVARMGMPLRSVLRRKGTPFDALGLDDPAMTDSDLLDAVERHPILIDRPIVVSPLGVKLCRPSEVVLELLEAPQRSPFVKEDGKPVATGGR
jgi:arsenate reductase